MKKKKKKKKKLPLRVAPPSFKKKKKKKMDISPEPGFEHAHSPLSDSQSIALTTRPQRLLSQPSKASYVYLAENALNALLSSAWDNGVSQ